MTHNQFAPTDLVRDMHRRTTSMNWPEAVHDRFALLHQLAKEAGERTSVAELAAALAAAAPLDGGQLGDMVRSYRRMTVAQMLPAGDEAADLLRLPTRLGRPRRTG